MTTFATSHAAETKPPCVDHLMKVTGSGLEVVVTCPFEISQELLDRTFEQIHAQQMGQILSAEIDHSSHPFFSPTLKLHLESIVTDLEVARRYINIKIPKNQYEAAAKKSACGNTLHLIKDITIPEKMTVSETKLTRLKIEGVDLACTMGQFGDMPDRHSVLDLLTALRDGSYLMHHPETYYRGDLPDKLDGLVDPDALEILNKDMREKAMSRKPHTPADDVTTLEEPLGLDPTLHAGEKFTPYQLESIQSIDYDAKSGMFTLWWSTGKYSAEGTSFLKIEGVWARHPRGHARFY